MARILRPVYSFIVLISFVHYGSSSSITVAPSPTTTIPGSNATATSSNIGTSLTVNTINPSINATSTVPTSSGNGTTTSNKSRIVPTPSSSVALSTTAGPPAKKTFEARITVNETYKPEYNDSSSAEFKEFASNFSKTVGEFFIKKQLPGFQRVEVKKLSKGSVVVDFDIEVQKSSNATVESIVKALVGGNGTAELGYTFFGTPTVNAAQQSPTSSAPAVTPSKAAPVTKATTATPTSSTKGTEIWDKAIDLATPMGTFIIVVVAVALIIILLIALICVCCKYRTLKKKTHFPDHMAINDSEWIRSSDDLLMWERNLRASEVKTTNGVSNRPINDKRT